MRRQTGVHRHGLSRFVLLLLLGAFLLLPSDWTVSAAGYPLAASGPAGASPSPAADLAQLDADLGLSRPTGAVYIAPDFHREMRGLRATILAAAARHNRPEQSGLTNRQFAEIIALLLYSEHIGWLDAAVAPLRPFSPIYQQAQTELNQLSGANLTIWPANLRPSVALEILRHEVPLRNGRMQTVPLAIAGSRVRERSYSSKAALYTAISHELSDPQLAVEYLAANLERGVYRARSEHVPVRWETLAAWHNQGIVAPADIRRDATVIGYLRRTAGYLPAARSLVAGNLSGHFQLADALDDAPSVTAPRIERRPPAELMLARR